MNDMMKYLIIVTLCYYLVKGLIYLILWQATYKVEERAKDLQNKKKKNKQAKEDIWQAENDKDKD